MSKSVVICKIAYYRPGDMERSNNRRHVEYIALKPEADRGDENAFRVGDEDYRPASGTAAGHVEYAAERPGSSGLFGPEEAPPPDWKQVGNELAKHDLPVWRLIISLREDDAMRLGFTERANWETAVRQGVQSATKAMHLDSEHTRWVAAFHQKQGHPHAHVVVWETPHAAARRQGLLETGERKGVWRAFARELFREDRDRLTAEKSAIRDAVRDLAKGDVSRAAELVKEIGCKARLEVRAMDGGPPGVLPTLREGQQTELVRCLEGLAGIMPGKGRVALAYMPPEVKAQARDVADWLLRQPYFKQSTDRYTELARELASHYVRKPEALQEAGRKAYDDLRDRVAQVVLRGAAELNRADRESAIARERVVRTTWRSAWRVLEKERLRAEAKAQLASMQAAERAEEKARREREAQTSGFERYS